MARFRNVEWNVLEAPSDKNAAENCHEASLAVLMDIREELRRLNGIMQCPNVQTGFRSLARIARQHDAAFKRRVENAVRKRVKRSGR